MKTACVLRWGAYGDMIMITPLLRKLNEDGYRVIVNTTHRGLPILKNNPFVSEIVEYKDNEIPHSKLKEYWDDISKKYDKFINLSGTIEGALLKDTRKPEECKGTKEELHRECNRNYYDEMFRVEGYEDRGKNGELYFSRFEISRAKEYRKKYWDKFIMLWSLSGSALHKCYPYAEYVARAFLEKHEDAMTLTVGDDACMMLEWEHPQGKCYSGKWNIRHSLIMTKFADLVIGTETGILNAAGCFDTPKIVMLSHSSEENLTKYWKNCISLSADVKCYPCHKMHYELKTCELDDKLKTPLCMAKLGPQYLFEAMENYYYKWREQEDIYKDRAKKLLFA